MGLKLYMQHNLQCGVYGRTYLSMKKLQHACRCLEINNFATHIFQINFLRSVFMKSTRKSVWTKSNKYNLCLPILYHNYRVRSAWLIVIYFIQLLFNVPNYPPTYLFYSFAALWSSQISQQSMNCGLFSLHHWHQLKHAALFLLILLFMNNKFSC